MSPRNQSIGPVFTAMLLLVVATYGCRENGLSGKPRLPVSGTMTINNKQIPYAMIDFIPADVARGIAASVLLEDGRFQIPQEKGLVPGEYDVLVTGYGPENPEEFSEAQLLDFAKARSMIPEFYQQRGHLKVLIDEGQSTDLVLELSSKPSQGS